MNKINKKHEKLYYMEAEKYKSLIGATLPWLAFFMVHPQEADANPFVQVFPLPCHLTPS